MYPAPPDRKLLAAQRLRNATSRTESGTGITTNLHAQQQSFSNDAQGWASEFETSNRGENESARRSAGPAQIIEAFPEQRGANHSAEEGVVSSPRSLSPSPQVAAFLFEIYFSRLYHASLLFHKRGFLADYAARKVSDFVAFSIFALATM